MFIKAAAGRRLRDPRTMLPIPDAGSAGPDTDPHWSMLVRMGDAVVVDEPQAAAAAHPTAKEIG